MKKTLLVLATLAATAGLAQAANVTLYGAADLGLTYKYDKVKATLFGESASQKQDSYGLDSGNLGASKFGLKGEEDLGNSYAVGFKLENGFSADDGKLGQGGRLFGREAALTLKTPFGNLAAGRMGGLSSGAGTYDIFQAYGDVFDGGVGNIGTGYWNGTGRYDNMLTYTTPDFAGFKVYAQYSFSTNGQEAAGNERNNNRYWGIGATYDNGPLGLVAVVDSEMPANDSLVVDGVEYVHNQDSFTLSLGGNYDFGVVKAFAGFQYGKHLSSFGFVNSDNYGINVDAEGNGYNVSDLKGYAVSLGGIFPLPCGSLQAGVFYAHTKGDVAGYNDLFGDYFAGKLDKSDVYGIGLVHSYPLSKRTTLYTGVGYAYNKVKYTETGADESLTLKKQSAQALFGINHTF